jgi:hypothetical protein
MEKHSEVFVSFDVAKKKHAVTIAEGGRAGEVPFLGDVENALLPIERTFEKLADRYDRLHLCLKPGRRDTGFTARSRRLATIAWWSLSPDPETVRRGPSTAWVRLTVAAETPQPRRRSDWPCGGAVAKPRRPAHVAGSVWFGNETGRDKQS